ncbi:MAG TPA: ATP-binding protein [Nevskiaceae bacterium]|nr:ATP-binding protein [Nevskiaceae bacterium]
MEPAARPGNVSTPPSSLSRIGILLLAPVSVALALAVRLSLDPWLAEATFMPFFIAVLASAWAGRVWSGLLAVALSTLACIYFVFDPRGSANVSAATDLVRVLMFAFTATLIVLICEGLQRARASSDRTWAALRRVQKEALLREEELHLALDAGRVITWDWNEASGRTLHASPREIFHFRDEDRVDFDDLVHPEDRGRVDAALRVAAKGEAPYAIEFRLAMPDGRVAWLAERAQRRVDAETGKPHLIGAAVDISERKQAEQMLLDNELRLSRQLVEQARAQAELQESEARFRTLVASIPQLVFTARPNGEVFWFNERWYEYTGTTPAQMENEGWVRCHDPAMLVMVRKAWADGVAAGGPIQMTFPLRGADGKYRPFLTRVTPLKDEQGRVLQWLGTSTDVSELRALEEQLRESDRRKDEFLATLAHELRNPLAPILTGLEVLKRSGGITPELEPTRAMMDRQVSHMARLLEDLLDVSRITRGTLELRKQQVDLAAVIGAAVETSRPLIDARRHRLTVIPSFDTVEVEADPHRLAQVFSNLLNNAAKYSESGGHILLTVEKQGYEVIVAIRDTGIGIAPSMIERVFEMFSQAAPSLERRYGGLGIGLSLARQLAEMHGGTITAGSDGIGKGAEFTVRLPIAVSASAVTASAPVTAQGSVQPLKIVVADDNRDAAEALAAMLSLQGDDVRVAYDGHAAVDLVRRFAPDVALLDIGMPRLNGYDACRRIRALPDGHRILCVALTGWGQDQDRRRSEEAGFNSHLVKPVSAETFEKLLAGARSTPRETDWDTRRRA